MSMTRKESPINQFTKNIESNIALTLNLILKKTYKF